MISSATLGRGKHWEHGYIPVLFLIYSLWLFRNIAGLNSDPLISPWIQNVQEVQFLSQASVRTSDKCQVRSSLHFSLPSPSLMPITSWWLWVSSTWTFRMCFRPHAVDQSRGLFPCHPVSSGTKACCINKMSSFFLAWLKGMFLIHPCVGGPMWSQRSLWVKDGGRGVRVGVCEDRAEAGARRWTWWHLTGVYCTDEL